MNSSNNPKYVLAFGATLSLAIVGCSNPSSQKSSSMTQPNAKTATVAESTATATLTQSSTRSDRLHPSHFGARLGSIFQDAKTKCTIMGPYRGEILGKSIGEPMEFDEAVRKCAALGTECDGITTDWYTGSPYTVVKVGAKFQFAEDSYAVSYRNQCRTN